MPILDVPFIGQWEPNQSNLYRNDCGVACVAMALKWVGKLNGLTVDQLARETSLAQSDTGLMPAQLATLAARHGLPASIHDSTTLDDIRREIDARRPVIVLLAYRYILGRLDQADNVPGNDGHFVLAVGYSEDDYIILNDSDYWQSYTERGHDFRAPVSQLDRAMAEYHGQCVFLEIDHMPIGDQIIALAEQIETLAAQITDAPPSDLPGTPMQTTAPLNVRTAPVTGAVVATLLQGDVVRVVDSPTPGWKQIVVGVYTGRYCSGAYLSPKP